MAYSKTVFYQKLSEISSTCERAALIDDLRYRQLLDEVKNAQILKQNREALTSKQYRRLKRYNILRNGDIEKLIENSNDDDRIRYYCKSEEIYDILDKVHVKVGHKRTRVMEIELKKGYCNITRKMIELYLSLCKLCNLRKKTAKRALKARPIVIEDNYMKMRGHVNLIDVQSLPIDGYRFILNYQDDLTKFTILRPLKTTSAKEVAEQLTDIFSLIGAPCILQSDQGRAYVSEVIQNLSSLWPELILVHGRSKRDTTETEVRNMLLAWLNENNNQSWIVGLKFIQSKRNRTVCTALGISPHEAMFCRAPRYGLADTTLPHGLCVLLENAEELRNLIKTQKRKLEQEIERDEEETGEEDDEHDTASDNEKEADEDQDMENEYNGGENNEIEHNEGINGKQDDYEEESNEEEGNKSEDNGDEENNENVEDHGGNTKYSDKFNKPLPKVCVSNNSSANGTHFDLVTRNIVIDSKASKMQDDDDLAEHAQHITIEDSTSSLLEMDNTTTNSDPLSSSSHVLSFIKCHCTRYCIDRKCKCKSKFLKCTSKCHNSTSCKNK